MYNFIEGDRRINKKIDYNKTVYVVLYSLGNESFSTLSEVFDALPSLIYHWSVKAQSKLLEPHSDEIQEMEIDEMWHFIGLKKEDYVSSKPLIVAHGELGQGFLATIILQPSKDST
ncbi:MAG: hypothetical protein FWH46_03715 [Methanimicrococcus sp.]|nr:hypothetical protein [Methanimicrococcus sp.]